MERPFQRRFSKKLYDPRNIDGDSRNETFEMIRTLHQALEKYPEFIGIDPFGSTIKGYSNGESDIDICILIDSESCDTEEKLDSLKSIIFGTVRETIGVFPVNIHCIPIFIEKDMITDQVYSPNFFGVGKLIRLFRRVSGKKILEYRKIAVDEMRELDEDELDYLVSCMVREMVELEFESWKKIKKRAKIKWYKLEGN